MTLDNLRAQKNPIEIQSRIDHEQVAIPCRPQKTFTLYVFDVPEDLPEEDIRHALYKFNSVVEVVRLVVFYQKQPTVQAPEATGEFVSTGTVRKDFFNFFLQNNLKSTLTMI